VNVITSMNIWPGSISSFGSDYFSFKYLRPKYDLLYEPQKKGLCGIALEAGFAIRG
jgi:hypothetical protein